MTCDICRAQSDYLLCEDCCDAVRRTIYAYYLNHRMYASAKRFQNDHFKGSRKDRLELDKEMKANA